jgi:hypothetical protein
MIYYCLPLESLAGAVQCVMYVIAMLAAAFSYLMARS